MGRAAACSGGVPGAVPLPTAAAAVPPLLLPRGQLLLLLLQPAVDGRHAGAPHLGQLSSQVCLPPHQLAEQAQPLLHLHSIVLRFPLLGWIHRLLPRHLVRQELLLLLLLLLLLQVQALVPRRAALPRSVGSIGGGAAASHTRRSAAAASPFLISRSHCRRGQMLVQLQGCLGGHAERHLLRSSGRSLSPGSSAGRRRHQHHTGCRCMLWPAWLCRRRRGPSRRLGPRKELDEVGGGGLWLAVARGQNNDGLR